MTISFVQRECNWLQALEGDIDTSHFGFLHVGGVDAGDRAGRQPVPLHGDQPRAGVPRRPTPTGARCTRAYRAAEPGRTYWRFANFMLPFWTQTPQGKFTEHLHNRAWVPMDDNHTMFVSLMWRRHPPSLGPDKHGARCPAFSAPFDYLPNTTDWYGRWRLRGRPENDWLIDRDAQRTAATTPASRASTRRTRR